MKRVVTLIITILSFSGCGTDDNKSADNLNDALSQIEIGGDGGEINLNRVTHGDQPIWMEPMEKDDLEALELLLKSKDTLRLDLLTYKKLSPWSMDREQLVESFGLQRTSDQGPFSSWESDLLKVGFRKDTVSELSGFDLRLLELDGEKISEYTIADLKLLFPKSYAVRNYYSDPYLINFVENNPESYDHLIVAAGETGRFFHLRLVDGVMVDVVFDDDRGY
jgi:hypothetical protein